LSSRVIPKTSKKNNKKEEDSCKKIKRLINRYAAELFTENQRESIATVKHLRRKTAHQGTHTKMPKFLRQILPRDRPKEYPSGIPSAKTRRILVRRTENSFYSQKKCFKEKRKPRKETNSSFPKINNLQEATYYQDELQLRVLTSTFFAARRWRLCKIDESILILCTRR
jgi:hypothetical protein